MYSSPVNIKGVSVHKSIDFLSSITPVKKNLSNKIKLKAAKKRCCSCIWDVYKRETQIGTKKIENS